ncbi:MAG TPA: DUF1902 domain-containing protein [Alphaproteobacteria bacterium]|nr:DUF1902 domain-containing protein [Alphaproteobacteria bacterium]
MTTTKQAAKVLAEWDREAAVWVATSYDIPGLVLSAPDKEKLVEKILAVARPLVEANLGTVEYDKISIDFIEEETVPVLAA